MEESRTSSIAKIEFSTTDLNKKEAFSGFFLIDLKLLDHFNIEALIWPFVAYGEKYYSVRSFGTAK